jgi:hypothetical protein
MPRLALPQVLVAMLLAATVVLFGQKGGLWLRPAPPVALAPTPAFLETQRLAAAAAAREAARQAEAAKLAALQNPGETPEALPAGADRDEVFYACTACHSTAIVRRTRLSRERWDELMDWMVTRHNMNPMDADQRRRVVDYLAEHFPPASTRGRNIFLQE